MYKKISGVDEA
jgi:hypothetical protein